MAASHGSALGRYSSVIPIYAVGLNVLFINAMNYLVVRYQILNSFIEDTFEHIFRNLRLKSFVSGESTPMLCNAHFEPPS